MKVGGGAILGGTIFYQFLSIHHCCTHKKHLQEQQTLLLGKRYVGWSRFPGEKGEGSVSVPLRLGPGRLPATRDHSLLAFQQGIHKRALMRGTGWGDEGCVSGFPCYVTQCGCRCGAEGRRVWSSAGRGWIALGILYGSLEGPHRIRYITLSTRKHCVDVRVRSPRAG